MKIQEYQAKDILKSHGITTPKGVVISTPDEIPQALKSLGNFPCVLKAQVLTGGRGKAGGILLAKSEEEARTHAKELLGKKLVTLQTGPQGIIVKKVLLEEGQDIARELYLAIAMDRKNACPVVIASQAGGMEIEEVAHKTPEKILTVPIDPVRGVSAFQTRHIATKLGLGRELLNQAAKTVSALGSIFQKYSASLVEINPLVVTKSNMLLALDAKMVFDDNGLFKHPELEKLRDLNELSLAEQKALKAGISYISLNGTIGCMVNGAGLAMATMDLIKLSGGEPANFLDVGGGANAEQVTHAFEIILTDKNVKAVLVNIFGGIMKCDVIAEGILAAVKKVSLNVPLVVRLEGTNVEKGREILKNSGLSLIAAESFQDAAKKVVQSAKF